MAVQIIVKAKLLITLGGKVNLSKRDWFIDSIRNQSYLF